MCPSIPDTFNFMLLSCSGRWILFQAIKMWFQYIFSDMCCGIFGPFGSTSVLQGLIWTGDQTYRKPKYICVNKICMFSIFIVFKERGVSHTHTFKVSCKFEFEIIDLQINIIFHWTRPVNKNTFKLMKLVYQLRLQILQSK